MTEPMFEAGPLMAQVRRLADLSQRELAGKAGVPQASVAALESGSRGVRLDVFARLVAAAGMRLAVLGPEGRQVTPFVADAARDNAGRRFPAHLDVRAPDDVPEERITSPRYDRADPKGWYHLRERRDVTRQGGETPHRHPTAGELEYRRLRRRYGRAPWWPAREVQVKQALGMGDDPSATD
jgi:HTH-type transcriptional regulator/antitoxin HipB